MRDSRHFFPDMVATLKADADDSKSDQYYGADALRLKSYSYNIPTQAHCEVIATLVEPKTSDVLSVAGALDKYYDETNHCYIYGAIGGFDNNNKIAIHIVYFGRVNFEVRRLN